MEHTHIKIQIYQLCSKLLKRLNYTSNVSFNYDPQDLLHLDHNFAPIEH